MDPRAHQTQEVPLGQWLSLTIGGKTFPKSVMQLLPQAAWDFSQFQHGLFSLKEDTGLRLWPLSD